MFSCHYNFLSTLKTPSNIIFMHSYDMSQIEILEDSGSGIKVEDLQILCGVCDKRSAILRWDENYSGFRGRCSLCEYDWAES